MAREVPEQDAAILCRACGLPDYDEEGRINKVPDHITDAYFRFKLACDRIDAGQVNPQLLAMIVMLAGDATAKSTDPVNSVIDLWRNKEITFGQPVICTWRNKKGIKGAIHGVSANGRKVLVALEDDAEVRELDPANVAIDGTAVKSPTGAELEV